MTTYHLVFQSQSIERSMSIACNLLKGKKGGQFLICQGHILLLMSGCLEGPKLRGQGRWMKHQKEQKMNRKGTKMKCNLCHKTTHNARRCPLNHKAGEKKNAYIKRDATRKRKASEAGTSNIEVINLFIHLLFCAWNSFVHRINHLLFAGTNGHTTKYHLSSLENQQHSRLAKQQHSTNCCFSCSASP